MRRLLAILLFSVFGLTTAAPLLAATQDPDAHLPACCRRNGAHHCMMSASTDAPAVNARCPQCPRPEADAPHAQAVAFATTRGTLSTPVFLPTAAAKAELQRRLSRERSRHKRGPPAMLFAA